MFNVQVTSTTMKLLPVVCLCLVTRCGMTSAAEKGPAVVKVEQDRDVILPCSLSTKENIELKLFDWKKAAQKDEKQKEVFFYDAGVHYNNGRSGQSEQFKGRVSHFPEELKHGNASIIIRNTKMADSGDYTCVFPRLDPRQTFHIKLVVGAAPEPYIRSLEETKDWTLLQCEVHGSPKPEVEWRDSAGNIISSGEAQVSERDGRLYFTLNTTVTKSDRYRCVATQKTINHRISAETSVYISANRKKNEMRKTGGGPAPPQYTASEELALANNDGRPIMEGIEGGIRSDPCASSSQHNLYVQVEGDTMVLMEPPAHVPHDPSPEGEENLHHSPQPTASTSRQDKRQNVGADTIRALYKRNLELDNQKKELEIKKLKLEIDILEMKTKHMQRP